ncbi:MAG: hypothetical protein PHR83_16190 [Paludibacter sp.]|nr:hypothetical protein [Paludibacter sp.]
MKYLITLIALIPCFLFSQETRTVTKKYIIPKDVETYNVECNETYEVLASNKKIKHGYYDRYISSTNVLIIEGYYKNNQKDSLWSYYHRLGKLIAEGRYKEAKRVGIWNFYNPSGNKLEQSFDYDSRRVLSYRVDEYDKKRLFKVYTDTGEVTVKPDCPPLFIGGSTALRLLLEAHDDPSQYTLRGMVIVTYDIDVDGKTSNFDILKGLNEASNETALRLAHLLSDNWIPCIYKGKPIKCRQEFTMTFLPSQLRF